MKIILPSTELFNIYALRICMYPGDFLCCGDTTTQLL